MSPRRQVDARLQLMVERGRGPVPGACPGCRRLPVVGDPRPGPGCAR